MILAFLSFLFYLPYLLYLQYCDKSPLEIYTLLQPRCFGNAAFSRMIGWVSPYTSTIRPTVERYRSDRAVCSIVQHPRITNPFRSIHALALANLGEITSGLLMMEYLRASGQQGIITEIRARYHRKARGKITATCDLASLTDRTISTKLWNQTKELVCEVECVWETRARA